MHIYFIKYILFETVERFFSKINEKNDEMLFHFPHVSDHLQITHYPNLLPRGTRKTLIEPCYVITSSIRLRDFFALFLEIVHSRSVELPFHRSKHTCGSTNVSQKQYFRRCPSSIISGITHKKGIRAKIPRNDRVRSGSSNRSNAIRLMPALIRLVKRHIYE